MALTQPALNAAQRRSIHFDISTRSTPFSNGYIVKISECKNGPINIGLDFYGGLYIKIEIVNQKILSMTAINNSSNNEIFGLNTSYEFKIISDYLAINNVTETKINSIDIEWTTGYFLLDLTSPNNYFDLDSEEAPISFSAPSISAGQIIVESFADALYTGNVQGNLLQAKTIKTESIDTKQINFGNWQFKYSNDLSKNVVTLKYIR